MANDDLSVVIGVELVVVSIGAANETSLGPKREGQSSVDSGSLVGWVIV